MNLETNYLENILSSRLQGARITPSQAIELWHGAPLELLGRYALEAKRQVSGDDIFYNRNIHIEPTNICKFNCKFCSYRRRKGSAEAWDLSLDQIYKIAEGYRYSLITEIHIVGGVHPDYGLEHYIEMIRGVKAILPNVAIKAFTAVELADMISSASLSYEQGLSQLRAAGMDAIPGGGAEIFDEKLRGEICPDKGSTKVWLDLHRAAHAIGIETNATILYGHVESVEQRVDHLCRLRDMQDETSGFTTFIPLKYRAEGNNLTQGRECSVEEDMRMLALSRLFLDNIPHIKSYWVMYGKENTERALRFGVDDIDGTIDDTTKIFSMAGAEEQKPRFTPSDMCDMVKRAGFNPLERDTHYNIITR